MGIVERVVLASSTLVAAGGGAMSAYATVYAPQFAAIGFWGGLALLVCGIAGIAWAVFHKGEADVSADRPTTTGMKVEHEGDGPAMEINHKGPAGAVINATAVLGQDVVGAHVIKKGSGGGLVINTYPGSEGPGLTINVGPKP